MNINISHIPRKKEDHNITDFIAIHNYLNLIFKTDITNATLSYKLPDAHYSFLCMCTLLEKACTLNQNLPPRYTIDYFYLSIPEEIRVLSENVDFKIKIAILRPEEEPPLIDTANELTGLEIAMTQNSHHTIKISYNKTNQVLKIYTNQILSWENLYKLKRIQYRIFQKFYTKCNPALLDFFDALVEDNLEKAQSALHRILNNSKLEQIKYEFLDKYFTSNIERLIAIYEEKISQQRHRIDDLQNQLAILLNEFNDNLIQVNSLNSTNDEFDIEFVKNYIIKHPYIESIAEIPNRDSLRLIYKAPLLYYDDSLLEPLINNATNTRRDILEILKEREYVIWTKCVLEYKPEIFWVKALPGLTSCDNNNIPHPHIDRFGCLGNHIDAIKDWSETGDYVGCLDQITAAVLNLNVVDGAVMETLIEYLINHPIKKCFQNNETKEFVSLTDILKEKNENGKTQIN